MIKKHLLFVGIQAGRLGATLIDEQACQTPPSSLNLQLDTTWKDAGQAMRNAMLEIDQDCTSCLMEEPKEQLLPGSTSNLAGSERKPSTVKNEAVFLPSNVHKAEDFSPHEVCTSR